MQIEDLDTPALIVDLDVLEQNLSTLATYCRNHSLQLRPHTKTHKIPEIARMQVESGAWGISVAKVGEAEVMAAEGLDNILIAYPVVGKQKLDRLARLARDRSVTLAADSDEALSDMSAVLSQQGSKAGVLIEYDVGSHRCGLQTAGEVVELAHRIQRLESLSFSGVMFFVEFKDVDRLDQVNRKIRELTAALRSQGLEPELISGGNTPTAYQSHRIEGLTEIRSGTYVFNDWNTVRSGGCEVSDCALRVLVTVVSKAVPGKAIVDGGSKTFSSDRMFPDEPLFGHITEYSDVRFTALHEEHGHLDLAAATTKPSIGEKLTIIPNHVCPCVNLHDEIFFHRRGRVLGSWKVRGRGKVQ